ncbi:hypothetical protein LTR12_010198 [Friedmanniomyces endolithicus]|nr:hypothetical protein LTR12_010198 [Friedmanniomyces endolithicus]
MASSTTTTTSDLLKDPLPRWPRGRGKDDGPPPPPRAQEDEEDEEDDRAPIRDQTQQRMDEQLAAQYYAIVRRNRAKGYRHRAVRTTSPRWAGSHLDGALLLAPLPAVLSPLAAGQQSPPQPDDRKRKRTLPSAPSSAPPPDAEEPAPKRQQRAVSPLCPDDTTTTTVPSQQPPPPPIPDDILALANTIKHLPITRMGRTLGHGFPSRNVLRTCAALEKETSRKTGCLMVGKRGGRLRAWRGDERLFSGEWWGYSCVEGWERGVVGEGKVVGVRKTWNSGSGG